MDSTRATRMQPPNPNPNPSQIDPNSHNFYATIYSSYYSRLQIQIQNPYPNPNPNLPVDPYKPHEPHYGRVGIDTGLKAPGIDPYSYGQNHGGGGYEVHQPGSLTYAHHKAVDVGSVAVPPAYYPDPNAGIAVQNLAPQYRANPYVTGGTIPPNVTGQLVPALPNSTMWTNPTIRPLGNGTWKRGPKKTKVVQSAWCEICRVDCNSKDVLEQHKLGKKHMKNLEKLKAATAPAPVASAEPVNQLIGPQENPAKGKSSGGQRKRKKGAESVEDLETKRRKILEGGAAAGAVRTCPICNVVCNSETVFKYHLAGQKHIAMMKKHALGRGRATAT